MADEIKAAEGTTEEVKEESVGNSDIHPDELKMAEKHGIIQKEEKNVEGEAKTPEEEAKAKEDAEKQLEVERENIRKKPFTEITEEESRKLTKNEQGYYWATKKERTKRQSAESERDYYIMQLQAMKGEIDGLKKAIAAKGSEATDEEKEIARILEDEGRKTDAAIADEKKMTATEWQQEQERVKREREVLGKRVNARLNEFELEAKQKYEDFDNAITLATEIFDKAKEGKLKDLGYDDDAAGEILEQCKAWVMKAANVLDKNTPNLSEIAYMIGKTHPKYGKQEEKVELSGGDKLSEEKLKKLAENSAKAKTSAGISGTGGGVLPVSEITLQQAKNMTIADWRKLPKETKQKLLMG